MKLILLAVLIFILLFLMNCYVKDMECQHDTQRLIEKHHEENMQHILEIERKLEKIFKEKGYNIQFCDKYYKNADGVRLLVLEEKVNDLESFLQSHSCQAKGKEDIQ